MKLILIAAVNRKRVIGVDGRIPWHISDDLKRFKRLTTGCTVLMGRKTFESIGKPLPNRRNVVLSSRSIAGVETFMSFDSAIDALQSEEKVFVIGGGQLYERTLERADEILLTVVDSDADGDTFFPPYEEFLSEHFTLTEEETHEGFVFKDYTRRKNVTTHRGIESLSF
jgi:dihydrofolate reductase